MLVSTGPDARRAAAFARWFDERTCTRIEPWRWGSLYLDREFPDIPDSNFMSIERVSEVEGPDGVVTAVERARSEAGLVPRRVVVDDEGLAEPLVPAFARAGWSADRYRLMVRRRSPEPSRGELEAREVPFGELMRFRDELAFAAGEVGESLGTHRAYAEKIDRAIGTRCFLSWVEDRAVSGCVLWRHGGDAQLDGVATLPAFRGLGAAGAAVEAAARGARDAGATWIHLYTDAMTGPVELYRRLGFDDVGSVTEFIGG